MKKKLCDWCHSGGPLDIGSGRFYDVDSDFSHGIPICGGCGGLGVQYDTSEFRELSSKIGDLRFAYCPVDKNQEETMTIKDRIAALKNLETVVVDLVKRFGAKKNSYAADIAVGQFTPIFAEYESRLNTAERIRSLPPRADARDEALRSALVELYERRLSNADKLAEEAMARFPEYSNLPNDYGAAWMRVERNSERALPYFIKAIGLEPKRAAHFYNAVKCFLPICSLNVAQKYFTSPTSNAETNCFIAAEQYLQEAKKCADYASDKDLKSGVDLLLKRVLRNLRGLKREAARFN